MRSVERFSYPRAPVRPLKIYAFDPMLGRDTRTRISVETRNEPLRAGPVGARIAVIDYDASSRCFYTPVDRDDAAVLMQGGIDHSEGDPRFHQQMVYAVASRIIEIFDRALGRPVDLGGTGPGGRPLPLRLFPHALRTANAFYEPQMGALVFGYFRADAADPGANIPGQLIFSCLSHDIIAHELTHALIDRLSPKLLRDEHRNPDTFALHEGLADLVPILHRFSFDPILREEIRRTGGKLDVSSPLVQVASQFGAALGISHGLRNARKEANPNDYTTLTEPHDRGALIISAVFEAMLETYQRRVDDLFQISGMRGAADGDLHPDLVNRISVEASRTALSFLTMCIRAFDYLPPVNVTFGDFLRAVVTADKELVPDDSAGQRSMLIEAFRRRGIYASGARSLAEESLIWERPLRRIAPLPAIIVKALTRKAQAFRRIRPEEGEQTSARELDRAAATALQDYARQNSRALYLSRKSKTEITTVRHSFRVAPDGQLVIEIIVQFVQRGARPSQHWGVTLVASADGSIRYVIPNQPIPQFLEVAAKAAAEANEPAAAAASAKQKSSRPKRQEIPFPGRYQLSPARYKKLYPELAKLAADISKFESFLEL
jgi:hypothetical protein